MRELGNEHKMNQLLLRNKKLKAEELKVQVSNAAKESWRCQYLAIVSTPVYKNLANYSSTRCV